MAGLQVVNFPQNPIFQILMITTGCIRRSRLAEDRNVGEYVGLVNQDE